MQTNKQNKLLTGFTIIELIVVIAIIAVLATIVLVNVTGYINKGKDASVQGNMATIMTNAAVYFDANGNYTDFATSSGYTSVSSAIQPNTAGKVAPTPYISAAAYCVTAPLLAAGTTYCVDSTGYKGAPGTAPCSATDFTCQ